MRLFVPILFAALFVLAGCPRKDDKHGPAPTPPLNPALVLGPAGGVATADGGAPVALTISGQVTFDRLPATATGLGSTPAVLPAQLVLIEVVRHNNVNDVVGATTTDAAGNYSINLNLDHDFYIRARAQSGIGADVDRVYHERTVPLIVHAVCGPILNRAAGSQISNLHAGFALPENRAGAFAILDTAQRLRAAALPSFASLGALDFVWCTGATIATGTDEIGPNGRPAIYLLGGTLADAANTDHDEFDQGVICHEWASFLQLTQSRDNNFGGMHAGEELLFTASYSEGVVTAIGCALLDLRLYRDTTGYPGGTTSVQFEFDLESGTIPGSGTGYGNEFRNSRAVWDLLDGAAGAPVDSDGDPVAISPANFFTSFKALATRGAPYEICWLASLLQQLIDHGFLNQTDANTLMTGQGAAFPPAGGTDPFPAELLVGGPAQAGTLNAFAGANPILGPDANGVFRLTLASAASVTINLTNTTAGYSAASHRLELSVHDLDRNVLALAGGNGQNKSVTLGLAAGTYLVRVQHRPDSGATSGLTGFSVMVP